MKYKIGDRVRIKSLDWYKENKDEDGNIRYKRDGSAYPIFFTKYMSRFCGETLTIIRVHEDSYYMNETGSCEFWTDEMIEGLAEDEILDKAGQITDFEYEGLTYTLPEGYIFKDENGNVINAQKIVLEKKKKEYPKTFEECVHVLEGENRMSLELMNTFRKLIDARNAYWKIAGEEMGLGKPWVPDWNNVSDKYCIYFVSGYAWSKECQTRQCPFAFPTPEMRDAFYENFKDLIEQCKELL